MLHLLNVNFRQHEEAKLNSGSSHCLVVWSGITGMGVVGDLKPLVLFLQHKT